MMFLSFFVWGAWFVTLGTHLGNIGFSGSQIGYAYLMNNIAAIISPFFVGMIADRYFASQKVMGVLYLMGGVIMHFAANSTATWPLILLLLLYNLTYMPTLALVNAVSFHQMKSPDKEFPRVRVWGTIGWIVAGLTITFIQFHYMADVEKSELPMRMAGIGSVLLGLYSFTLPNTPPQNVGKEITFGEVLGVKALRLMKERSFFIFVLCSLLISIPLAFYYGLGLCVALWYVLEFTPVGRRLLFVGRGRSVARRRLARKPKWRMRTKPLGSRCNRKRRRNSSRDRGISSC
jgi:nucleoside transporter